jgi:hypothetical protein
MPPPAAMISPSTAKKNPHKVDWVRGNSGGCSCEKTCFLFFDA